MKNISYKQLIKELDLKPLKDEGGYFKRTFNSKSIYSKKLNQSCGSAIYYLITSENFSKLHKLKHPEIYHFYYGDPVTLTLINKKNEIEEMTLGIDFHKNQRPQIIIPENIWQSAKISKKNLKLGFSLVGTTVSPEYKDNEFILGKLTDFKNLNHSILKKIKKLI